MRLIIPEAGSDLGIGTLRMLKSLSEKLDHNFFEQNEIVLMDAIQTCPFWDLVPVSFVALPRIDTEFEAAKKKFLDLLCEPESFSCTVLPTGEFFPQVLYDGEVSKFLHRFGAKTHIPAKQGWEISRDKSLLGLLPWAVPTSSEWGVSQTFSKPALGVGSRNCREILTGEEAKAQGPGMVYTKLLPGNDWVVDAIKTDEGWHLLTREVSRQRGGADVIFRYLRSEELEKITIQVADRLEASVINVQFRKDADGKPYVIDVGTRLSGASCAALHVGVNWIAGVLGVSGWWDPHIESNPQIVRRWEEIPV
jgi:hypothetical protein